MLFLINFSIETGELEVTIGEISVPSLNLD